jgi:formylglycine-generating enzyme required for sulfatase activity
VSARRLGAIAACVLAACTEPEVRPQRIVVVDTDAHVPRFGDRLLIEVADPSGWVCAGCRRVFDVSDPARWPHSFGVGAEHSTVRLRLYRARDEHLDENARASTTIDLLARLPPVDAGVRRVRATLRSACAGRPADPSGGTTCVDELAEEAPLVVLADDTQQATLVGSWAAAEERACTSSEAADERCIPGGAFYMGEHGIAGSAPPHMTIVRPFFLDVDEVRVSHARAFVKRFGVAGGYIAEGAQTPTGCQIPADLDDADNDRQSANCVSREFAAVYCQSIGKRLPTEAELEWASTNDVNDTTYAWGNDELPRCGDVVLARGPVPYDAVDQGDSFQDNYRCAFPGNYVAPPPTASGLADVTQRGIRDLGGGMAEWAADDCVSYEHPCWTDPEPSPVCPGDALAVMRGGNWRHGTEVARRSSRRCDLPDSVAGGVGFRCARDDGTPAPPRPAPPPAGSFGPSCEGESALWLLPDTTIGAASVYSNVYVPVWALDGLTTTSWFTEEPPNEAWIEISFADPVAVTRVDALGTTGPLADEYDFLTAQIELYGSDAAAIRIDAIPLTPGSADGTLLYAEAVPAVERVRFRGLSWEFPMMYPPSPGLGELHVFGFCAPQ